jgi:hypothetical protein
LIPSSFISILMSVSKRLQIVMPEAEIEALRKSARKEGLTLSEWARKALKKARQAQKGPTPEGKLKALVRALECDHPTADIDDILTSIERGRGLR